MLFTESVWVGIDASGGRKSFTYAALDHNLSVVALADAEMDDVAAFLGGQKSATVAINAPSYPSSCNSAKSVAFLTPPPTIILPG